MGIKVQPLVESNNKFAFDLYAKLATNNENLCFSPFSAFTALAMTFAGARRDTEKQMANVMHVSTAQHEFHNDFSKLQRQINSIGQNGGNELLLANSIYPCNEHSLLKSFVNCLKENYDTIITPLNYNEPENARKFINRWVNERTKEHISEIIPPGTIGVLTRLVLVNALYFKGAWENPFEKQATTEGSFWVRNDYAVKVPMMRKKAGFAYSEDDLAQVLEIPYQGNNLSLMIILPKERLFVLEKSLLSSHHSRWLKRMSHATVDVHLPSFKIESKKELNDAFVSMGMFDAFHVDKADFSGMDGWKHPEGFYISNTIHQATIEVNEEGTTATAATAMVLRLGGMFEEYQFNVNRPFLFLLRENTTGCILFIGRVLNPAN